MEIINSNTLNSRITRTSNKRINCIAKRKTQANKLRNCNKPAIMSNSNQAYSFKGEPLRVGDRILHIVGKHLRESVISNVLDIATIKVKGLKSNYESKNSIKL